MKCKSCETENEDKDKFCATCGTPLFIPERQQQKDKSNTPARTECPYCGHIFEVAPKRKKPCPKCGEPIYVWKGRLCTEDDAGIEYWLWGIKFLELTKSGFDLQREELSKELGRSASISETEWRILNLRAKSDNPSVRMSCYDEMARLAASEGKDPKPYQVESVGIQLNNLKSMGESMGEKFVQVHGCNDDFVCPKCKSLNQRIFPIDVAIREMPVPNLCRSEFGCRCTYYIYIA